MFDQVSPLDRISRFDQVSPLDRLSHFDQVQPALRPSTTLRKSVALRPCRALQPSVASQPFDQVSPFEQMPPFDQVSCSTQVPPCGDTWFKGDTWSKDTYSRGDTWSKDWLHLVEARNAVEWRNLFEGRHLVEHESWSSTRLGRARDLVEHETWSSASWSKGDTWSKDWRWREAPIWAWCGFVINMSLSVNRSDVRQRAAPSVISEFESFDMPQFVSSAVAVSAWFPRIEGRMRYTCPQSTLRFKQKTRTNSW